MASPTQCSAKPQKRATNKPFIPALPILPGKKSAKPEVQVPESAKAVVEAPARPEVTANVAAESSVTQQDPTPSNQESPGQEESSFVTAATDFTVSADSTVVEQEAVNSDAEAVTGVTLEPGAAVASDSVPPQDEHPEESVAPTERSHSQVESDQSRTGLSTASSVTSHTAPLVIDSSGAKLSHSIRNSNLTNGSGIVDDGPSYMFQAPPESSSEPSPTHAADVGRVSEPTTLSSEVGPLYVDTTGQAPFSYQTQQMAHLQSIAASMPQAVQLPSNFSPSAAEFTPSGSTPPYSLSSTPAVMAPPASFGNGANNVHDLGNRNSITSLPYQPSNASMPTYDQTPRRPGRARQSISHAHGEQKTYLPRQFEHVNAYSRSRANSTGNDGLFGTLTDHLTSMYDHGTMADWKIIVSSPDRAFPPIGLAVHSAVISRCATLYQQMQPPVRNKKEIQMQWNDTYVHPSSFNMAVRYLYNESSPSKEDIERWTFPGEQGPSPRHLQLHWVLSYYLSGCMLNIGPVIKHARELVRAFFDWDLLETAMHWAIDYRPKPYYEMDNTVGAAMSRTPSGHSSFSDATSSSRPKVLMPNSEMFPLKTLPNGSPLMISQLASDLLLEQVVFFLASRVQFESFVLDSSARPTEMKSRLHLTKESASGNRTTRNTALQGISFGEFSAGPRVNPYDPEYQNYVTSVAFLNLPFDQIKGLLLLLQRRNDPRAFEFAKQVIADRENHRNQVLRSKSVTPPEREQNYTDWYDAGWHEFIADAANPPHVSQLDGYHVTQPWRPERVWTGFRNPAMNGGARKKNFAKKREQEEQFDERFQVGQLGLPDHGIPHGPMV